MIFDILNQSSKLVGEEWCGYRLVLASRMDFAGVEIWRQARDAIDKGSGLITSHDALALGERLFHWTKRAAREYFKKSEAQVHLGAVLLTLQIECCAVCCDLQEHLPTHGEFRFLTSPSRIDAINPTLRQPYDHASPVASPH